VANWNSYIRIHDEVNQALTQRKAVVALESTIISHGMPYPKNLQTAMKCQEIVREAGAIPATIGVIEGVPVVGLTRDEIEVLAQENDVHKISRRDIPFAIAKGLNGATTVASTMILARLAGIQVFATGGIGGVHRGAQQTMDVSADITELAKTDVAVVCGGCKSVLDIGLTLENLETHGVSVLGYKTKEFPAFYTLKSGFRLEFQADDPAEIATALRAKWDLGLKGGMVIANPIPKEFAMDQYLINEAIDQALEEAENSGIWGKDVTPFLLSKIEAITEGSSLNANQELVYNNCLLAAQIAVELANKAQ